MNISDIITTMIEEMMSMGGGVAEFGRNEVAQKYGCVPSQINYVLTSRFTPERGYKIESRRGGGGYVKITKINLASNRMVMHLLSAVGGEIDFQSARACLLNLADSEILTPREYAMAANMMSDKALSGIPPQRRNALRAALLKAALISVL